MPQVEGFSHVGLSTHDMEATIEFYQGLLGLPRVAEELTRISGGGTLRQVYFSLGSDQFMVFMEPRNVKSIPAGFDTSINGALGVPMGLYHFAIKVTSLEKLVSLREALIKKGVEVSNVIDLGHARSVFFNDPNGLQLELCFQVRPFNKADLSRVSTATVAS
jgi:catechol 2,3-dioxygenase-like lactoylglutathione lyase family enzyme